MTRGRELLLFDHRDIPDGLPRELDEIVGVRAPEPRPDRAGRGKFQHELP